MELWYGRDMLTGQPLKISPQEIIEKQHQRRLDSHPKVPEHTQTFEVGETVFANSEGSKLKARDQLTVTQKLPDGMYKLDRHHAATGNITETYIPAMDLYKAKPRRTTNNVDQLSDANLVPLLNPRAFQSNRPTRVPVAPGKAHTITNPLMTVIPFFADQPPPVPAYDPPRVETTPAHPQTPPETPLLRESPVTSQEGSIPESVLTLADGGVPPFQAPSDASEASSLGQTSPVPGPSGVPALPAPIPSVSTDSSAAETSPVPGPSGLQKVPTPDFGQDGHSPPADNDSSRSSRDDFGTPPAEAQASWFNPLNMFFGAQPPEGNNPPPRQRPKRETKQPKLLTYTKNFEQTETVIPQVEEDSTSEHLSNDSDIESDQTLN